MGGSNMKKVSSGHGLSGSGKGHPPTMGVTGPGGIFMGTTSPQDTARSGGSDKISEIGGKKVPGGVGVKNLSRTGGQGRKFAGVVGTGGYEGTK